MKKILVSFVMICTALLFAASVGFALPVAMGDDVYFQYDTGHAPSGGPFKVFVNDGYKFNTFCVETKEQVSMNTLYKVDSIGSKAELTGFDILGSGYGDEVAWVYIQYLNGNLGASSAADAQKAIWWFVEEELYGTHVYGVNNALVTDAGNAAQASKNAAALNVQVFNPVEYSSTQTGAEPTIKHKQSMLVRVPEPGTMILFGFSLLGLGVLRRKFRTR